LKKTKVAIDPAVKALIIEEGKKGGDWKKLAEEKGISYQTAWTWVKAKKKPKTKANPIATQKESDEFMKKIEPEVKAFHKEIFASMRKHSSKEQLIIDRLKLQLDIFQVFQKHLKVTSSEI
jgi:hypothetical protein